MYHKIDGRLKSQDFRVNGLNGRIYCWKNRDGSYHIGINGTSQHFAAADKREAEHIINNTKWRD